jgi:endonuclease YncB( thermonuclease family)
MHIRSFLMLLYIITSLVGHTASASEIKGAARVLDGRTLEIGAMRIFLRGIDAPSLGQVCGSPQGFDYRCGEVSKQVLQDFVDGGTVVCEMQGVAQDGVSIGTCGRTDRPDVTLNEVMVYSGWAVALWHLRSPEKAPFPCSPQRTGNGPCEASIPDYLQTESMAVSNKRGLWSGVFDLPWVWRSNQRIGIK